MTTQPSRAKPGRKPDPLTPILAKIREAAHEQRGGVLRGGRNPDAARGHYRDRAVSWNRIADERRSDASYPQGRDADMLEWLYRALGAEDATETEFALVQLAAMATAAIADLDRGAA